MRHENNIMYLYSKHFTVTSIKLNISQINAQHFSYFILVSKLIQFET